MRIAAALFGAVLLAAAPLLSAHTPTGNPKVDAQISYKKAVSAGNKLKPSDESSTGETCGSIGIGNVVQMPTAAGGKNALTMPPREIVIVTGDILNLADCRHFTTTPQKSTGAPNK